MKWSIGFRLGFLLACFSVLAAMLVGYLTFVSGRDMLNDRAQRSLLGTTQILAQHMQTGFSSVARDTAMLAALVAETQATQAQANPAVHAHDWDMLANVFRLGTSKSLASGVSQWPNWPIISKVSGRMPWRTTARPRTLRLGVAISIGSPSAMPNRSAVRVLTMTPRWPLTLSATSLIICMPTLPPQAYCIERAVSSQNG